MPLIPITLLATALLAAAPAAETSTPAVVVRHSQPVDNGTLSLDTQAGPVRIPIDLRGNHIYMRGRINDSDSLWIVLDSGASGNVVDDEVAKRLGLEITSMGQGRGAAAPWMPDRFAACRFGCPERPSMARRSCPCRSGHSNARPGGRWKPSSVIR